MKSTIVKRFICEQIFLENIKQAIIINHVKYL